MHALRWKDHPQFDAEFADWTTNASERSYINVIQDGNINDTPPKKRAIITTPQKVTPKVEPGSPSDGGTPVNPKQELETGLKTGLTFYT